jgi:hypothetical protein
MFMYLCNYMGHRNGARNMIPLTVSFRHRLSKYQLHWRTESTYLQRSQEQPPNPRTDKERHTETGEVGKFSGIIRRSAHTPIRRSLPHRIQNAGEEIEPDCRDTSLVVNAHLCIRRDRSSGVISTYQNESVASKKQACHEGSTFLLVHSILERKGNKNQRRNRPIQRKMRDLPFLRQEETNLLSIVGI